MAPSNNMLERNQQMSFHSIRAPNGDLPVQSNLEFLNSGMPPPTQSAQTVSHGFAPSNLHERNQQTSLHSIKTPNVDLSLQSNLELKSGMPPPMQSAHTVSHGIMAPSNNMLERNQQTSLHSIQTPNVDLPVQSNLEFNSGMPPPRRRDPSSISLQSFPQPEKHQNHHHHSDERNKYNGMDAEPPQLEDTNKGLDLLTRAAISLKRTGTSHETENSLRPAKYQRQMGIPGHSNGIHQEIPNFEEV
jgi:hypothetical protein